jgi:predicted membrane protein
MLDNGYFCLAILVLYIIVTILSVRKSYIKGGLKRARYDLKTIYNSLAWLANCTLALFFVLISLIPTPQIKDWANAEMLKSTSNLWVMHIIVPVYAIITIILACWIIFKGLIPQLKYNDEEKQWEKESKDKFKAKMKGWLHIGKKTDDNIKTS